MGGRRGETTRAARSNWRDPGSSCPLARTDWLMTVPSLVLGIAGGTGAGKTTIARRITEGVDAVAVVPLDNYYRERSGVPLEERREINYDHPDAFDWPLVREQLSALCEGRPVEMPQYDFTVHDRTGETVHVEPGEVIVVEGILALYDRFKREAEELSSVPWDWPE